MVNQVPISPDAIMAHFEFKPTGLDETPTWFELVVAFSFLDFASPIYAIQFATLITRRDIIICVTGSISW
jgi:hypothetical protein